MRRIPRAGRGTGLGGARIGVLERLRSAPGTLSRWCRVPRCRWASEQHREGAALCPPSGPPAPLRHHPPCRAAATGQRLPPVEVATRYAGAALVLTLAGAQPGGFNGAWHSQAHVTDGGWEAGTQREIRLLGSPGCLVSVLAMPDWAFCAGWPGWAAGTRDCAPGGSSRRGLRAMRSASAVKYRPGQVGTAGCRRVPGPVPAVPGPSPSGACS